LLLVFLSQSFYGFIPEKWIGESREPENDPAKKGDDFGS
jgi:hypothetical protein